MSILSGAWDLVKGVGSAIGGYVKGAATVVWTCTTYTFKGTWAMTKVIGSYAKASWNEDHGFRAGLGILAGIVAVPCTFVAGVVTTAAALTIAVAIPVIVIGVLAGIVLPLALVFTVAAGFSWLASKAFGKPVMLGTIAVMADRTMKDAGEQIQDIFNEMHQAAKA